MNGHWHLHVTNTPSDPVVFSLAVNEGGIRGIVFNAIRFRKKSPTGNLWFFYFGVGWKGKYHHFFR